MWVISPNQELWFFFSPLTCELIDLSLFQLVVAKCKQESLLYGCLLDAFITYFNITGALALYEKQLLWILVLTKFPSIILLSMNKMKNVSAVRFKQIKSVTRLFEYNHLDLNERIRMVIEQYTVWFLPFAPTHVHSSTHAVWKCSTDENLGFGSSCQI